MLDQEVTISKKSLLLFTTLTSTSTHFRNIVWHIEAPSNTTRSLGDYRPLYIRGYLLERECLRVFLHEQQ